MLLALLNGDFIHHNKQVMNESDFNHLIHAPNRLQICAFLMPLQMADFRALKEELGVSDSVLSKHLKLLDKAGYITQTKSNIDGRKCTWISLTKQGRSAFRAHVKILRQIAKF